MKLLVEKEITYLQVYAYPMDWDSTRINGIPDDNESPKIPCLRDDNVCWSPCIHLDTGKILNWPKGVIASVNYRVKDEASYHILDLNKDVVFSIGGYVPDFLEITPKKGGDHIVLKIDAEGVILNWKPDIQKWFHDNDESHIPPN
jgi:hypothetical protein